jgi:S-DNA-T family DNA segregation ATPase FtsK/SpoIIIE
VIGICTAAFLQTHFHTVGTRLILMAAILIGLLLAADDLVLRAPGLAAHACNSVATNTSKVKFSFPTLPNLFKRAATRAVKSVKSDPPRAKSIVRDDDDDEDLKPAVLLKPENSAQLKSFDVDDEDSDEPAVPPLPPRADIIVKLPSMVKPRQISPPSLPPPKELGEYHLPPWDFLDDAEYGFAASQEKFVREKAAMLEQAMKEFNIDARVVEIDTGPVITMYELELAPGIKVSSITALSNDIMRALRAESVRIVAPVPGKNTVGIEAPNAQKEKVRLKELMATAPDATQKMALPLYLGKDASGEPLIADLTGMPHCLIAGTTGSGKSVCINSIIMSILYQQRPDRVKLILVDPKVVEMAPFKDVPHLMCPIINDAGRATSVLEWACEKMDERYEVLAEAGVRNIKGYNALTLEELVDRFKPSSQDEEAKIPKHLPYIIIIIDELADLMMTSGKEVESFIVRLAQKSRAVGIHLVVATQRPQANVVTGLIKSNMPSRIAFRVASKMDSRIVLDQNGADLLLGQGDMLFLPPGAGKPIRGQGTFIDDKEMKETVKLVRTLAEAQYEPELVQIRAGTTVDEEAAKDELFDAAVRVVLETKRGSVSLLQRRLTIGYSRASRLIEAMANAGIVGSYKGSQAREALFTVEEWDAMQAQRQADAASGMTV